MTEVLERKGKTMPRDFHRPGLPADSMFRLWRAAIKDDNNLTDMIIEKIYDEMIAFDCERATEIIESIVRRDRVTAAKSFPAFLRDMPAR
jgi:hypothetical protein